MAATPAFRLETPSYRPRYRPRRPRATSLYQLLDTCYERLKGLWEERFERHYGFWRGFYGSAVMRYLDCGLFESGFPRAVRPKCRFEFRVAFSCNEPPPTPAPNR